MDDVGRATLVVVEDTGLRKLDTPLAVLEEGSEPLGVVVVDTAGGGVVWDGKACDVVVVPTGTVGRLTKGVF